MGLSEPVSGDCEIGMHQPVSDSGWTRCFKDLGPLGCFRDGVPIFRWMGISI